MWVDKVLSDRSNGFYSVMESDGNEMADLKALFPDPEAQINRMNFLMFATGGVHGCYTSIEDVEDWLLSRDGEPWEECPTVTFLVIHSRRVALRYGVAHPRSVEDIEFLKLLKKLSAKVLALEADR